MKALGLILATLTVARTTMGFQFQSVAALGPVFTAESPITYTQLGLLIGIYLLPGMFFAIPGGWLGKRFGDKQVVLAGLAMMTLGGAVLAMSSVFEVMFIGRLVAGLGGVLLNVLVTKMVTDWFAERGIATAMGILISSWPLGIAIALMIMNPLENLFGLETALLFPTALCAVALLMVAVIYRDPTPVTVEASTQTMPAEAKLSSYEIWGILLSGSVWCLYNMALILPLSFGAEYLVAQGVSASVAGASVSLTSWLIIPALPLGAWLAERVGKPMLVMSLTFLVIAALVAAVPFTASHAMVFALIGIIFGPAGGLIIALPSRVLQKQNRAMGMGIFFTIYYVGMGIVPAIAGFLRDLTQNPAAPFYLGSFTILLALLALAGFRLLQARQPGETV